MEIRGDSEAATHVLRDAAIGQVGGILSRRARRLRAFATVLFSLIIISVLGGMVGTYYAAEIALQDREAQLQMANRELEMITSKLNDDEAQKRETTDQKKLEEIDAEINSDKAEVD